MLAPLHKEITKDFNKIAQIQSGMDAMSMHTVYIEHKIGYFSIAHNELVNAHTSFEENVLCLCVKVIDLEDRSWIKNIKLRGILEEIATNNMPQYNLQSSKTLLPTSSALD